MTVAGSWSGTAVESPVDDSLPPLRRDRMGLVRLQLQQSGAQVTGSGVAKGSVCLPTRFAVSGVVTGRSVSLGLVDEDDPAATASAMGQVVGNRLQAAYTGARLGCDAITGTLSLMQQ